MDELKCKWCDFYKKVPHFHEPMIGEYCLNENRVDDYSCFSDKNLIPKVFDNVLGKDFKRITDEQKRI